MHAVIAWSGFLGAWLLVAGPLFQAAVELDDEDHQRTGLSRAAERVDPPEPLSPWWWLLPPVAYVLQRRRRRTYRRRVFGALSRDEVETFVEVTNVSTGWAMVAGGAFFIAVKETYEVAELYAWPGWVFVTLLVVMLLACAANTVVRMRRAHADRHGPDRPCGARRPPGGRVTDEPVETVEPEELHALVGRVPVGWTEVGYAGRTWGLTRSEHAAGGTTALYAEELGGTGAVSANVWHTSGGDVLRPCEMPARDVLAFLRGWAPASPPAAE